jgi:NAD(P)-dependent dehydrogenase (short-subunit alcohol dehydrogenase family)
MDILNNKTVVITGGCGQVGYATAKRLAQNGARIFTFQRKDLELAKSMMDALPNNHLNHVAIQGSITDLKDLKRAVDIIKSESNSCDILVNAAGINQLMPPKDLEQYTDEMFDSIVENNLRGPFSTIREFLPLLKNSQDALIVNLTSAAGVRASNSNLAYGASKAGLELITQSISKILAPKIRVVALCPGYLESATTGITKHPSFNEMISKEIPLGRVGTGDDVASVIEALATTMKYITGSTIRLDGGRLA